MKIEECSTCRFWRQRADDPGRSWGGYCVRFPPAFPSRFLVDRNYHTGGWTAEPDPAMLNDAWPMTHAQSWCGEYAEPAYAAEAIPEALEHVLSVAPLTFPEGVMAACSCGGWQKLFSYHNVEANCRAAFNEHMNDVRS